LLDHLINPMRDLEGVIVRNNRITNECLRVAVYGDK
jgi:hypothetical protein